MIRVLQDPGFDTAFLWVIKVRLLIELDKHVLPEIFGFGRIAKNPFGDGKDETVITKEQYPQRVGVTVLHLLQ